jgi:hypothetical protein
MSDKPEDPETGVAEDIDPGEPISALELAAFEHDASSRLVMRIRRSIQRRTTLGQLTSFSVRIPLVVLREFWSILSSRLNPGIRKDSSHGAKTS